MRSGRPLLESLLTNPRLARAIFVAFFAIAPLALLFTSGTLTTVAVILAVAALALAALAAFDRLLQGGNSRGYELLAQEHEWDLVRPDGSLAVHRKRLRVRYLNQAISVVDFAWGDGNLFAEYSCDPGRVVDQFAANGQLWVLISLGGLRRRGEEETLTFNRAIGDGFLNTTEWIEADSLEGRRVSLRIVFPKNRPPERVEITRRRPALLRRRAEHREVLPGSALEQVSERRVLDVDARSSSPEATLQVSWTWPSIGVFISCSDEDADLAEELAASLQDHGLTVKVSADRDGEGGQAHGVAGASAIVLIAGHGPAGERRRSEWSAALDEAWSPDPLPVAVLLVAGAKLPASLRALPGFSLPPERAQWPATFERLRKAMWPPEALIREADIKPQREIDRPPVGETLARSEEDPTAQRAELARDLAQRRESLEAELARARRAEDLDAARQSSYSLAITLSHLGELERAAEMFRLAISLTESEFGESHQAVADGTYNLALAYAKMGRASEAVELLERAIALGESSLGTEHPKVRVYRAALDRIQPTTTPGST
jgi:hypothetical protein